MGVRYVAFDAFRSLATATLECREGDLRIDN